MSAPEEINAVLTFVDPNGRRWLTGALLGPLVAEDDTTATMSVMDTLDTAPMLVSFKIVRPQEVEGVN